MTLLHAINEEHLDTLWDYKYRCLLYKVNCWYEWINLLTVTKLGGSVNGR